MATPRINTAIIAGAGFSFSAGLPLTKDIFGVRVFLSSDQAATRMSRVLQSWQEWSAVNPTLGPEQFLSFTHSGSNRGASWPDVVEYVAAALATPRGGDVPSRKSWRYAGRINEPVRSSTHMDFWRLVQARLNISMVATTNYDLLIERGLRHKPMTRPSSPGLHYGGFPRPQWLKGDALPFSVHKSDRVIALGGTIPLYKLHGSLSWSFESGNLQMYQDSRPAFRRGGTAAIIPPLTEKTTPPWLGSVWAECEAHLKRCPNWLVVGYSLPTYDIALSELFARAGSAVENIWIVDPYAAGGIFSRWSAVAPSAQVVCLPGLPGAL